MTSTASLYLAGLALGLPLTLIMISRLGKSEASDLRAAKDVNELVDNLIRLSRANNPVARIILMTLRSALAAHVKARA